MDVMRLPWLPLVPPFVRHIHNPGLSGAFFSQALYLRDWQSMCFCMQLCLSTGCRLLSVHAPPPQKKKTYASVGNSTETTSSSKANTVQ
jgi:hypothetical protein